jgi:hypothetical protein
MIRSTERDEMANVTGEWRGIFEEIDLAYGNVPTKLVVIHL